MILYIFLKWWPIMGDTLYDSLYNTLYNTLYIPQMVAHMNP